MKKRRQGNTRGLVPVWVEKSLSEQVAILAKQKKIPKGEIIADAMRAYALTRKNV